VGALVAQDVLGKAVLALKAICFEPGAEEHFIKRGLPLRFLVLDSRITLVKRLHK
jgi:hypothetical protein